MRTFGALVALVLALDRLALTFHYLLPCPWLGGLGLKTAGPVNISESKTFLL